MSCWLCIFSVGPSADDVDDRRHKVTKSLLYQQFPQAVPAGLSAMSASAPNVPSTPAFHKASGVASAALWKQVCTTVCSVSVCVCRVVVCVV